MYDVLIIGCGITGAAAAYELSKYRLRVAVLEKENDVADATTKANSAILHAGYDPLPGTLMARFNVEGSRLARELCTALDVPYRQTGSLVLAFSEGELPLLRELYERGVKNGVEGLELLDGDAARALEPAVSPAVAGALHAPTAAVVSPWEYALALAETAVRNGVELFCEREVNGIEPLDGGGYRVRTAEGGCFESRFIVNAAGVNAAEIHDLAAPPAYRIRPNRGQYYLLDKSEGKRTSRVLFQCPTKAGKGVLVAPTVHGNLIVGPNAEDVADGGDVATTAAGLERVAAAAVKSVPSVNLRESIRNFAGLRAHGVRLDGTAASDFLIGEGAPGFFELAGIMSPGLTAAPAIARYLAELLASAGLALEKKEHFINTRKRVRMKELSPAERNRLIEADPRYGRVVCRCETVTEGEIAAALHTPIPPRTLDGVKRRVGAGMGRCQGGFCGPRVLEIIARELSLDPTEVLQDGAGSKILLGETKGRRE